MYESTSERMYESSFKWVAWYEGTRQHVGLRHLDHELGVSFWVGIVFRFFECLWFAELYLRTLTSFWVTYIVMESRYYVVSLVLSYFRKYEATH